MISMEEKRFVVNLLNSISTWSFANKKKQRKMSWDTECPEAKHLIAFTAFLTSIFWILFGSLLFGLYHLWKQHKKRQFDIRLNAGQLNLIPDWMTKSKESLQTNLTDLPASSVLSIPATVKRTNGQKIRHHKAMLNMKHKKESSKSIFSIPSSINNVQYKKKQYEINTTVIKDTDVFAIFLLNHEHFFQKQVILHHRDVRRKIDMSKLVKEMNEDSSVELKWCPLTYSFWSCLPYNWE